MVSDQETEFTIGGIVPPVKQNGAPWHDIAPSKPHHDTASNFFNARLSDAFFYEKIFDIFGRSPAKAGPMATQQHRRAGRIYRTETRRHDRRAEPVDGSMPVALAQNRPP